MLYPSEIDWRRLPIIINPGSDNKFRLPYYEKKAAQKIMRYNLTSATPKDLYARADFRYFFMGVNLIFCLLASGEVYAAEIILKFLSPLEVAFMLCLLPLSHRTAVSCMPAFKRMILLDATYLPGCLVPPSLHIPRCQEQVKLKHNGLLIELAHLSHTFSLSYPFDKIPVNHISITRCVFNPAHDLVAISNKDKSLFIFNYSTASRKNTGAVMYIYNVPKNTKTKRTMYITNMSWSPNGLWLLLQTTDGILTSMGKKFSTNYSDIKLFRYYETAHIIRKLTLKNYIRCQTTTQTPYCWLSDNSFFVTRRFTFDTKLIKVSISNTTISETLLIKDFTSLTTFQFISFPPLSPYNHLEVEYVTSLVYSSAFPNFIFYVSPCLSSQPSVDRSKHDHNCLIKYNLLEEQPVSVIRIPGYIQKIVANDKGLFFAYSDTFFTCNPLMEKSPRCPICPLLPNSRSQMSMYFARYTAGLFQLYTPWYVATFQKNTLFLLVYIFHINLMYLSYSFQRLEATKTIITTSTKFRRPI